MGSPEYHQQEFSGTGLSISPRSRQGPMLSPHGLPRSPGSTSDGMSIRSHRFDGSSPPPSAFTSPKFSSPTLASPTFVAEMQLIPPRSSSSSRSRSRSRRGKRAGTSPTGGRITPTRSPAEKNDQSTSSKSFRERMSAVCSCFGTSSSSPRRVREEIEVEKIEPVHWTEI
jgi:hypothetical protein